MRGGLEAFALIDPTDNPCLRRRLLNDPDPDGRLAGGLTWSAAAGPTDL